MAIRRLHLPRNPSSRQLRTALGGVLVALPLALGGAHPEVNATLAVVVVALLALALRRRERSGRDTSIPLTLPVATIAIALGATLLQIVPLPIALIRLIAPGAYDVLTMSLGDDHGWAALSMDPPATYHEVLKLIAYLCAALLGVVLFRERRHRRELLVWISIAGGTVAAIGFLHALAGLDRPYGAFGQPNNVFVSVFINPNHLAGFLGLCSIVALGLALSVRANWKWVHLGNAVIMGAGVVLTLSRGGILAYVGGLLFLAVGLAIDRLDRMRRVFAVQVALVGALLVAGYLAHTQIVHELWTLGSPEAFSKAEIWRPAPAMLRAFPLLGVGRGAFFAVYPKYRLNDQPSTFTHLENEWLQALVDWGPFVGTLLIVLVAWLFLRLLGRAGARANPSYLAAAAALLFLSVQNVGDFNLTLSAVALPVVLVFAVLARPLPSESTAFPESEAMRSADRRGGRLALRLNLSRSALWSAAAALAVLTVALVPPTIRHTVSRDAVRLRDTPAGQPDAAALESLAATITARHPADYLLPLIVGQSELSQPDGARRALRWINRGMYLAPHYPGGHRLAGRALLELGARQQALSEYRQACAVAPWQTRSVLDEVWSLTHSPAAIAVVGKSSPLVRLVAARFLLRKEAPELARDLASAAVGPATPSDDAAPLDDANVTAQLREALATALQASKDTEAALVHARALQLDQPDREAGYRLGAKIEERMGQTDAALATLDRGIANATRPGPLFQARARLLLRLGRLDEAREVVHELRLRAGSGAETAQAAWLLGQIYRKEGRNALALRELERARDFAPQNLSYRMGIAAVRDAIGDFRGARAELMRALADFGNSPALEEALARVLQRAARHEEKLRWNTMVGNEER